MAGRLLITMEPAQLTVAPGASCEAHIQVQNLTTLLDQVSLAIEGVDPTWVQFVPALIPVFGQGTGSARMVITPPADPGQAVAGTRSIRIAAKSQESGTQEASATGSVEILPVGDYELSVKSEGAENFSLAVHNRGNGTLRLRPTATAPGEPCWFRFEPFELTVLPGETVGFRLTVRPKQLVSHEQEVTFEISLRGSWQQNDGSDREAPTRKVTAQSSFKPAEQLRLAAGRASQIPSGTRYTLRVYNPANQPVEAHGAVQGVEGVVSPATLHLSSQAEGVATVELAPAPGSAEMPFTVVVTSENGAVTGAQIELVRPAQPEAAGEPAAPAPFPWIIVVAVLLVLLALGTAAALLLK
jgi:hypothetical protein